MNTLRRVRDLAGRTMARAQLRGATKVGRRPRTYGAPYIKNRGTVEIGDDFFMSSDPVVSHIVVSRGARVVIGDGVTIGSGAAIACEAEVHIGDGVHIGRNVMILDTDFHDATSMSSPGTAVPVIIEAGARLDDAVIILKGARVGARARIGGASVVSGVIASGTFASGVPARTHRTPSGGRDDAGDVAERVRAVVAETFDVTHPLETTDGPAKIVRWDSLGTLRLLLALEDEFELHLTEDALHGASSVGALVDVIERTR